ncbi:HEAT repeat protein [Necator americanus]|uniref:HEAT repeat protein n=1 Tax=Necator americanus TaxID=51031 RepID=W2TUJ0_NECAM|nr:HEAT repeat protein [Necator americanus]ETN84746.1 HEAT repeat protein [Necator americanus]
MVLCRHLNHRAGSCEIFVAAINLTGIAAPPSAHLLRFKLRLQFGLVFFAFSILAAICLSLGNRSEGEKIVSAAVALYVFAYRGTEVTEVPAEVVCSLQNVSKTRGVVRGFREAFEASVEMDLVIEDEEDYYTKIAYLIVFLLLINESSMKQASLISNVMPEYNQFSRLYSLITTVFRSFLSMDESHSLLLNEEALRQCPDAKKPVFLYEWLRYLDRILPVTQRVGSDYFHEIAEFFEFFIFFFFQSDLKSIQPQLVQQLLSRVTSINGPPIRYLLARCLARIYLIGDSSTFGDTLNLCNDTLKIKDDSPSQLPAKLAALACIASFYETMGRCGSSFVDTFPIMVKWLKIAESQGRAEILMTLSSMVSGLGSGASNFHKDVYKAAKAHLADRVMPVRTAALQCLTALVPVYPPLYSTELEAVVTLCTKALDGSNYETRLAVAKLLGVLLATTLQPPPPPIAIGKPTANARAAPIRPIPLEDALHLLAGGFLRGGIGGFLKGGSNCSTATVGGQKDVRAGIAMGYVELMREMGALWLERNLSVICRHLLELAAKCGGLAYTNSPPQAAEAIFLRRCVSYILRATVGTMLSEQAQITACKYLGQLLADYINSFDYSVEPGVERILGAEAYSSAQAAVVATLELSNLVRQIGTAVTPLFVEASGIMEPVFACLLHPIVSARTATAWCLRCITMAVPSQLTPLIDRCLSRLEHMKSCTDAISGYSLALAALVAAASDCKLGIPHGKPKQVKRNV